MGRARSGRKAKQCQNIFSRFVAEIGLSSTLLTSGGSSSMRSEPIKQMCAAGCLCLTLAAGTLQAHSTSRSDDHGVRTLVGTPGPAGITSSSEPYKTQPHSLMHNGSNESMLFLLQGMQPAEGLFPGSKLDVAAGAGDSSIIIVNGAGLDAGDKLVINEGKPALSEQVEVKVAHEQKQGLKLTRKLDLVVPLKNAHAKKDLVNPYTTTTTTTTTTTPAQLGACSPSLEEATVGWYTWAWQRFAMIPLAWAVPIFVKLDTTDLHRATVCWPLVPPICEETKVWSDSAPCSFIPPTLPGLWLPLNAQPVLLDEVPLLPTYLQSAGIKSENIPAAVLSGLSKEPPKAIASKFKRLRLGSSSLNAVEIPIQPALKAASPKEIS